MKEFHRARDVLFAGTGASGRSRKPPAEWLLWSPPRPTLTIDKIINDLMGPKHGNAPRIEKGRLAGLGIDCPFYEIRARVAWAAGCASADVESDLNSEASGEALGRFADDAELLAKEVKGLLLNVNLFQLAPPRPGAYDELLALWQEAMNSPASLVELADMARRKRAAVVRRGQPGRVWERGFARGLIPMWNAWTGRPPDPNKGCFHKLLDAAVIAIDRPCPESWVSAIRSAKRDIAARQDEDRLEAGSQNRPEPR